MLQQASICLFSLLSIKWVKMDIFTDIYFCSSDLNWMVFDCHTKSSHKKDFWLGSILLTCLILSPKSLFGFRKALFPLKNWTSSVEHWLASEQQSHRILEPVPFSTIVTENSKLTHNSPPFSLECLCLVICYTGCFHPHQAQSIILKTCVCLNEPPFLRPFIVTNEYSGLIWSSFLINVYSGSEV